MIFKNIIAALLTNTLVGYKNLKVFDEREKDPFADLLYSSLKLSICNTILLYIFSL